MQVSTGKSLFLKKNHKIVFLNLKETSIDTGHFAPLLFLLLYVAFDTKQSSLPPDASY